MNKNVDRALIRRLLNEPVEKSSVSDPEKRLMELMQGAEPKNESEKIMKKQIEEIVAKGGVVEIPSM